jgi:hypothetical protein
MMVSTYQYRGRRNPPDAMSPHRTMLIERWSAGAPSHRVKLVGIYVPVRSAQCASSLALSDHTRWPEITNLVYSAHSVSPDNESKAPQVC